MRLDLSVAPEIARLAGSWDTASAARTRPPAAPPAARPGGATPPPAVLPGSGPVTVGYLAACLRALVADPQAWSGRVRFDARQALRVPVPAPPARCEAWLLVAPPGDRGDGPAHDHGWQVACVIAGELEQRPGSRPLLPGRVLVRGEQRAGRLANTGAGYAISLHARPGWA